MTYYAIHRPQAKRSGGFLCHVLARDEKHALSIARNNGHRLPRGSVAIKIGRDGYFPALRRVFK